MLSASDQCPRPRNTPPQLPHTAGRKKWSGQPHLMSPAPLFLLSHLLPLHPASVTAAIASTSTPVSHFPFINRFSCFFILTLEYDFPVKCVQKTKEKRSNFVSPSFLISSLVFLLPSVLLSSGFCLRTFSFHSTIYLIAPSTHLGFLFRNFLF